MRSIFLVFAYFSVIGLYAQDQKVPEEVISFDVLKWHYSTYPNSQGNEWTALVKNGQQLFRVKFEFEKKNYQVEYNSAGNLMKEVLYLEEELPVSLSHQLEEYEKYKVNSFLKISDMQAGRVVYRLDLKIKLDGSKTIWYDENLMEMPNTDFSHSLSDLY